MSKFAIRKIALNNLNKGTLSNELQNLAVERLSVASPNFSNRLHIGKETVDFNRLVNGEDFSTWADHSSGTIIPLLEVAIVTSEVSAVPKPISEMALFGLGFLRKVSEASGFALIVQTWTTHSGIGLDPHELLTTSKTEGKSFGTNWINRFFSRYEHPVIGQASSFIYGNDVPTSDLVQEHFTKAFNELAEKALKTSMEHIEHSFAL